MCVCVCANLLCSVTSDLCCRCSIAGDFQDYVRVGYNFNSEERMRQGMENLVKVVREMQAEK